MLRRFCRASAGPQTPKGLRRAFYFFDRLFVVLWVDTVGAVGPHPDLPPTGEGESFTGVKR